MHEFFTSILDTDEIRQGDIIRMINPGAQLPATYGVIVTADCDIAQKKAGGRYTWLEILPMKRYIDGPWAEDQLEKLVEKHAPRLCEALNAQIKKLELRLSALTPKTLAEWLCASSPEEILAAINGAPRSSDAKLLRDLGGFTVASGIGALPSALERLRAAWSAFNIDDAKQQATIQSAMKASSGFQDYFVLPELPKTGGIGFVVMLRSMSTLVTKDLYLSEQDARIDDRPHAFHRMGRLSDGVRFAITQKLAFLFSRIGMPKSFESACETATQVMVEELFEATMKKMQA